MGRIFAIVGMVFILLFVGMAGASAFQVDVISPDNQSFSPSKGEMYEIGVKNTHGAHIDRIYAEIKTSDGELIKTLPPFPYDEKKGLYIFAWDGKDDKGRIVPDEVYHPIFTVKFDGKDQTVLDFRGTSGGEEVYEFEKKISPRAIEYTLPVDSRVIVRAGIKNGPMLKTIVDWEPRIKGFHMERWNGKDHDNVRLIENFPDIAYLIMGYKLSKHSIITYGNKGETYRAYRESNDLPVKQVSYDGRLLDRNGVVIRPEFYQAVLQKKSPRIEVDLLDLKSKEAVSSISRFGEILVSVDIHELDEIYLDQERYEISFFVDNEFISEEEQGFVPFRWKWSPGKHGVGPGGHILTVNVSGYKGQVGVRNIPFNILDE